MIALDTNILLRYILEDDPEQASAARTLIEDDLSETLPGFVSLVVICELAWSLQRAYGQPRQTIAATLLRLLESRELTVEGSDIVTRAVGAVADIADAIIHEVGRAAGCTRTLTFDRRFARLDGVDLLALPSRG